METVLAKTLTNSITMKRFSHYIKEVLSSKQKRRVMWFEVPMYCMTRQSKDEIILATIETLEQKIKVNKL